MQQVVKNEPMKTYAEGSDERIKLQAAVKEMLGSLPFDIPCIINGKEVHNRLFTFM